MSVFVKGLTLMYPESGRECSSSYLSMQKLDLLFTDKELPRQGLVGEIVLYMTITMVRIKLYLTSGLV